MSELMTEDNGLAEHRPLRILHVISGLGLGGAETMLFRLVTRLARESFACHVVSMTTEGEFGPRLRSSGIPVSTLGMRRGIPSPAGLLKLVRLLRRERPAVVQTWMYHADLLGGLAAHFAGKPPVVWGIHHTDLRPGSARRLTRLTARLNARLSSWLPAKIVCVSQSGLHLHEQQGHEASRMIVIPNGFDLDAFRPDAQARQQVRVELGLLPESLLVGHIARFHPQKGHHAFIRAAVRVRAQVGQARFLLAGEGVARDNQELAGWIREAGLESVVYLLGKRLDSQRLLAALDVFCLSSSGESFPLAVGEAMACGVPCVVTDVGDAAAIVGPTGLVVPSSDVDQLADALVEMLAMPGEERARLGEMGRERIRARYSLEAVVDMYARLYRALAKCGRG